MRREWISRHALPAITVVVALSAGCGQTQDRDALFKDVSKRRGAYVVSEPNLTRVEIPTEGARSYYYFTQLGHDAYPAVIIRRLEGGTFRTEGFTSGDKAAFDRWKAAFLERDALRRSVKP